MAKKVRSRSTVGATAGAVHTKLAASPAPKAALLAEQIQRILANGERLTTLEIRQRLPVKVSNTRASAALLGLFGATEVEREATGDGRWLWWRKPLMPPVEFAQPVSLMTLTPEQAVAEFNALWGPTVPSRPAAAPKPDPIGLNTRFDAVIEDVEALVADAFDAGVPSSVLKHLTAAAFDLARAHRRLPLQGTIAA